jgi:hypothetical protein
VNLFQPDAKRVPEQRLIEVRGQSSIDVCQILIPLAFGLAFTAAKEFCRFRQNSVELFAERGAVGVVAYRLNFA